MSPAAIEYFGPLGAGRCREPPAQRIAGLARDDASANRRRRRPDSGHGGRRLKAGWAGKGLLPARFFPQATLLRATPRAATARIRRRDWPSRPGGRYRGVGPSPHGPRCDPPISAPGGPPPGTTRGAERRCRRWPQGGAGGSSFTPAQTSSQQTVRVSPPVAAAGKRQAAQIHEWSVACPPPLASAGDNFIIGSHHPSIRVILSPTFAYLGSAVTLPRPHGQPNARPS